MTLGVKVVTYISGAFCPESRRLACARNRGTTVEFLESLKLSMSYPLFPPPPLAGFDTPWSMVWGLRYNISTLLLAFVPPPSLKMFLITVLVCGYSERPDSCHWSAIAGDQEDSPQMLVLPFSVWTCLNHAWGGWWGRYLPGLQPGGPAACVAPILD